MKKKWKLFLIIFSLISVLGNCKPYDAFELSSGEITVQEAKGYNSDGPYIAVTAKSKHYKFDSSTYGILYDGTDYNANGNEDYVLNAGETVLYQITVGNYGKEEALDVSVYISTRNKYVTDIFNTSAQIGNFHECDDYSADTKTIFDSYYSAGSRKFRFTISPDAPTGHIVRFDIDFHDTKGNRWQDYFLLTVY